jgi:hypothetical protein
MNFLHSPAVPECYRDEAYYTPAEATRMVTVVSKSTLRRWIVKGWTSFGLSLDVERRKGRLLVPELKILEVQEFLSEHPLPRPGTPAKIRAEFRQAVQYALFDIVGPRSAYSRARTPHPSPR